MRNEIVAALLKEMESVEHVVAFWEGGSMAMGHADQWSDLDLQIMVADGKVDETWPRIEAALQRFAPIERRYEVPRPSWHGHWQAFYRLEGVSPYLLVDLVVMEESTQNRFLEPEIHGTPVVYLDRKGMFPEPPTDARTMAEKIKGRLPLLEEPAEMFHLFVDKEVLRDHPIDAYAFYWGMLLQRLVEALRIRYCPWRYNFGLRYLSRDLPKDVYAGVVSFFYVADYKELPARRERVMGLLRETLAELKSLDFESHLNQHR